MVCDQKAIRGHPVKSAGLRRFRVACWLIALLCAPLANAQEKGARAADDRSPPPSTEPKAPETNPSSGPDEQRPSESAAASAAPSAVAPAATPPGQPHNASADVPAEG